MKLICWSFGLLTAVVFSGVVEIREQLLPLVEKAETFPHYLDLLPGFFLWSFVLIGIRYVAVQQLFTPLAFHVLSLKKRQITDRRERFANVLFKFCYYAVITSLGFYLMKEEMWFPVALGGSDADRDLKSSFSGLLEPISGPIKLYFQLQLGYHCHSMIYLLAQSTRRNDFVEMLCHHAATILLMSASYCCNYIRTGLLVLFTHDIGDVTGYLIKAVVDSDSTAMVVVCYINLLASWFYTRLYVFPIFLINSTFFTLYEIPIGFSSSYYWGMHLMLFMLQCLHIYWYALFLKMGYTLITTGKKEDIQQKCADKEEIVATGDVNWPEGCMKKDS